MTHPATGSTICRVYLGTYTRTGSRGIYLTSLDARTGQMADPVLAAAAPGPSFLALHPDGSHLYAVGEHDADPGGGGVIRAFRIDPPAGVLSPCGQAPSGGRGPCHLVVDRAGHAILAANYGSGSVSVLPLRADGTPAEPAVIRHVGSGPDLERQAGPHAHSVTLDAANRFAFAADLGADRVFVYAYDARHRTLRPHHPPAAAAKPGAGPRHFAFHPSGRSAYLVNELDSTVVVYGYDAARGVLSERATVSSLPAGFTGTSYAAEIAVHPSGQFLYASNRGHDSIAAWLIDDGQGTLTPVGHASTLGRWPRHFAVDPTGSFLLVANQNSDNVTAFRIDLLTGSLQPTGQSLSVPAPTCVRFVPLPPSERSR